MKLLLLPFTKGSTFYFQKSKEFYLIPTITPQANNYACIGVDSTICSIEIRFLKFCFGVIK